MFRFECFPVLFEFDAVQPVCHRLIDPVILYTGKQLIEFLHTSLLRSDLTDFFICPLAQFRGVCLKITDCGQLALLHEAHDFLHTIAILQNNIDSM